MKGNTLNQFIDDLLTMGGPEKEFIFRNKRYFLETVYHNDISMSEMYVVEIRGDEDVIFSFFGKNFKECVEQFEQAKIFDGLDIYEAETDIEVLFG